MQIWKIVEVITHEPSWENMSDVSMIFISVLWPHHKHHCMIQYYYSNICKFNAGEWAGLHQNGLMIFIMNSVCYLDMIRLIASISLVEKVTQND